MMQGAERILVRSPHAVIPDHHLRQPSLSIESEEQACGRAAQLPGRLARTGQESCMFWQPRQPPQSVPLSVRFACPRTWFWVSLLMLL